MKAKIQTLLKQVSSGNFNSQSSKILRYVGSNDKCTIDMMRKDLKLAHQSLTARISDLEDLGVLYVEGITSTKGIFYSLYRYENNPVKRKSRAKERAELKFRAWKKRGLNEFLEFLKSDEDFLELIAKGEINSQLNLFP
jgi:hypothetical protein